GRRQWQALGAQVDAVTAQDPCAACPGLLGELLEQPGLTDPGFPVDEDELCVAGAGQGPRVRQRRQVVLPPHEAAAVHRASIRSGRISTLSPQYEGSDKAVSRGVPARLTTSLEAVGKPAS